VIVLGLDISTSIIGYAVMDGETPVVIGHIDFKKCNDIWEKADKAKEEVEQILSVYAGIQKVYVEESLLGFSTGLSSAATLFTLAKFNALVSYFVRAKTGKPVEYISASAARKTVGVKVIQKKKCGLSAKEQTFNWAVAGPLKDRVMPLGRTGKFKPFVYDEVDGYVIGLAGAILNKSTT
jgi:hypothetical protein